MIPIGIFTKTFQRNSLVEVLQAVQENGYECVHFNFSSVGLASLPEEIPRLYIDEIKATQLKFDLPFVGVSATFNMAHPDQAIRSKGLLSLSAIAQSCAKLNIPMISLCTGSRNIKNKWAYHPENESRSAWLDMLETMQKAIAIAEEHDVYLGIEPEASNIVNNIAKAKRLLQEMQSDRLRIILDIANLFVSSDDLQIKALIEDAIQTLGDSVSMVHAKDRNEAGDFVAPGMGIIPFDFLVEQLDKAKIACPIVAHGFHESSASTVSRYLKSIKDYE